MREPAFWYAAPGWQSHLLTPLAAAYGEIAASRMSGDGVRVGIPVVCVGNYHVGGAGKTPSALALVRTLRDLGETPVVLSRGYGGSLRGPVKVDAVRHDAGAVGDEPLMMADHVTVVVSRDRVSGAALARSTGASVIVMDDGFQNPAVAKDTSLVVVDATRGLGNGCVLPAGPLRAPLDLQMTRTDALIIVGDGVAADGLAASLATQGKPIFHARFKPDDAGVAALRSKRVLAFAGIGDPQRFFRTLKASDIDVAAQAAFPDHHRYTQRDIEALLAQAGRDSLTLVTTEKDLVKLRAMPSAAGIAPFAVTLALDETSAFRTFIQQRLNLARASNFRA